MEHNRLAARVTTGTNKDKSLAQQNTIKYDTKAAEGNFYLRYFQ